MTSASGRKVVLGLKMASNIATEMKRRTLMTRDEKWQRRPQECGHVGTDQGGMA